ncbi:hypothetical protein NDU88_003310 [Pleurodeles waltl]|uniref:Uncharacterized protein n=1 Tax=Pleurodeles waltl TaxID=8319 RepID=A0AAV7SG22_PLEWA|nr:hypothetical protein NDU88_003310 [Pleurodeles waltl]
MRPRGATTLPLPAAASKRAGPRCGGPAAPSSRCCRGRAPHKGAGAHRAPLGDPRGNALLGSKALPRPFGTSPPARPLDLPAYSPPASWPLSATWSRPILPPPLHPKPVAEDATGRLLPLEVGRGDPPPSTAATPPALSRQPSSPTPDRTDRRSPSKHERVQTIVAS